MTLHYIKALLNTAVEALIGIVNIMLWLHYSPPQWGCADVIVLPKSGQAWSFLQNYLLPVMGKIAEVFLLRRLQWTLDVLRLNSSTSVPDTRLPTRFSGSWSTLRTLSTSAVERRDFLGHVKGLGQGLAPGTSIQDAGSELNSAGRVLPSGKTCIRVSGARPCRKLLTRPGK